MFKTTENKSKLYIFQGQTIKWRGKSNIIRNYGCEGVTFCGINSVSGSVCAECDNYSEVQIDSVTLRVGRQSGARTLMTAALQANAFDRHETVDQAQRLHQLVDGRHQLDIRLLWRDVLLLVPAVQHVIQQSGIFIFTHGSTCKTNINEHL